MRAKSAGILLYRFRDDNLEFLVCHVGGPYGRGPDKDRWSIPKGKIEAGEDQLEAAKRELLEETGISDLNYDNLINLGVARQSRKDVFAWGARYLAPDDPIIVSNLTTIEWPRGSGTMIQVPEIDRGEFVSAEVAKFRLIVGQKDLVDRLIKKLS